MKLNNIIEYNCHPDGTLVNSLTCELGNYLNVDNVISTNRNYFLTTNFHRLTQIHSGHYCAAICVNRCQSVVKIINDSQTKNVLSVYVDKYHYASQRTGRHKVTPTASAMIRRMVFLISVLPKSAHARQFGTSLIALAHSQISHFSFLISKSVAL